MKTVDLLNSISIIGTVQFGRLTKRQFFKIKGEEIPPLEADDATIEEQAKFRFKGEKTQREFETESKITAYLGLMVVDLAYQKFGLGTKIINFARSAARNQGFKSMRFYVVHPRDYQHPVKSKILAWYAKLGASVTNIYNLADTMDPV